MLEWNGMQFANCFEIGVGRVYEVLHGAYTHFFPVRRLSTSQLCSEKMSLVIPYDSHVLQIINLWYVGDYIFSFLEGLKPNRITVFSVNK